MWLIIHVKMFPVRPYALPQYIRDRRQTDWRQLHHRWSKTKSKFHWQLQKNLVYHFSQRLPEEH